MVKPLALAALLAASAAPSRAQDFSAMKFKPGGAPAAAAPAGATCSPSQQGRDKAWVAAKLRAIAADCRVQAAEFRDDPEFQSALDFEGCKMRNAFSNAHGGIDAEIGRNPSLKLDKAYLQSMRTVIAGAWGAEGADLGLRVAVIPFMKRLTNGGLEYLATLSGVPADIPLLRPAYPGWRFYDCNADGKPGPQDALLTLTPAEQVTDIHVLTEDEGKVLQEPPLTAFERRVVAAFKASAAKFHPHVKWASTKSFKANTALWIVTDEALGMVKGEGKTASAALLDMQKSEYGVECICGMQIALHSAVLELLGAAKFDKLYGDDLGMNTGFHVRDNHLVPAGIAPHLQATGDPKKKADADFLAKLKPGTIVYFNNPPLPESNAWHGENAVYLGIDKGDRQYFAHPFGFVSETALIAKLIEAGGTGPYLHQGVYVLKPSLESAP